jgi:hypothetical protein
MIGVIRKNKGLWQLVTPIGKNSFRTEERAIRYAHKIKVDSLTILYPTKSVYYTEDEMFERIIVLATETV